jgi:hypothetical protein
MRKPSNGAAVMAQDGSTNPEHLKPNTLKRSKLMHVEVPNEDGTAWTKIDNKAEV